jgi:hypothetical protein
MINAYVFLKYTCIYIATSNYQKSCGEKNQEYKPHSIIILWKTLWENLIKLKGGRIHGNRRKGGTT